MNIEDAIKQLESFCRTYENEDIRNYALRNFGPINSAQKNYEATKMILEELNSKIDYVKILENKLKEAHDNVIKLNYITNIFK